MEEDGVSRDWDNGIERAFRKLLPGGLPHGKDEQDRKCADSVVLRFHL